MLATPTWEIQGRLLNLGLSGVSLEAEGTSAHVGDEVAVELRLDGPRRAWQRLPGRVSRVELQTIAVELGEATLEFRQLFDEISNASHTNDRRLCVVMVDATDSRRIAMAEAFRSAGCQVIDVATPLAAIHELGESHFEPDLIAIADSLPAAVSDELRRFVEAEHPQAKLVRISDDTIEPVGFAHWLSTTNPGDDLLSRIRAMLGSI